MALVPEYKYPDGPGYLNLSDDDKIFAGYQTGGVFLFRDIIDIDMTGLSPSVHYDNPVMLHKFTLDNDVELRLYAWYDTVNSLYAAVWKAFYNNVEFTSQQYSQSGLNTGMAGEVNDSDFIEKGSFYKTGTNIDVPWKLVVQTLYPANPTENVTPADSFAFYLFGASHRNVQIGTEWVDIRNDLDAMQPNILLTFDNLVQIPYGDGTQRVDYNYAAWRFYNLNTTSAYMKTAGKGTDKNITGGSNQDPETPEDDPSQPGGGGGTYDPKSDPIDFPALPNGGALSSGALKAFLISSTLIRQLFEKLWNSSIFDIALQFQKLVDNPIDCIISLHAIPVVPETGGVANIKIGSFDTEISGIVITNQYLTIDCGSLNIKECWGSALDYAPYTTCEIYLPFIGIQKLKVEDVMKSTVHIKYNIDVFTGDCLCNIKCGQSVLYKFSGNLKQDIPVSGRASDMGIKAMIGSDGALVAAAVGVQTGLPPMLMGAQAAVSTASAVASSKTHTTRSGNLAGSIGLLDDFRPFFIFHRPVQSLAGNFRKFKGYPSNITRTLSDINGYTEVEYINLQNIPNATSAEMDEIKSILTSGAIF